MNNIPMLITEEERQLLLLAMAITSRQRPGLDYALSEIARRIDTLKPDGKLKMYEALKEYNPPSRQQGYLIHEL